MNKLIVVCGPCVIESEEMALRSAEFLKDLFSNRPIDFIYKSSYDKANRSTISAYRGPGLEEGLRILERVRSTFDIPIFTDVHTPEEACCAGAVCDVIQIPAFLSRQTDLLVAAGKSGCRVNIKKGQFMAPWDIENAIDKILSTGNNKIILTDRGVSFGYQNLVSDFRAIPIMQKFGFPVLYDATHSIQLPGSLQTESGGMREFIPPLSRASLAAGADGIYAEAHPDPENAACDRACQIPFHDLSALVDSWERIYEAMHTICTSC
ncbi:MAG: 3-deoxy-8-phosphooctulonate synthase [Chlamydiales bacterium]